MLVEKQELRKIIVEETIITLIENGRLKEAQTYLLENEEHLDENAFLKLASLVLPRAAGGNVAGRAYVDSLLDKIEQEDKREFDELEQELDDVITKNKFEKEKVKAAMEAWFKKRRQDAPGERLEDKEEYKRAVDAIIDNLKNAEIEQIANTGGEDDAQDAGGEELEAETPAKTAVALKDMIADPAQRKFLLRGLLQLLTNDSVEKVLSILKPTESKDAVLKFLKQVTDMEPKVYKKFKSAMQGELYDDLMASEKSLAGAGASAARYKKERVGREAGRKATERLGKLGLEESISNIRDREKIEKVIIFEILDLFIENKNIL